MASAGKFIRRSWSRPLSGRRSTDSVNCWEAEPRDKDGFIKSSIEREVGFKKCWCCDKTSLYKSWVLIDGKKFERGACAKHRETSYSPHAQ